MNKSANNIFTDIPKQLPVEIFETLLLQDTIRIERIISKGHSTSAGEWYDQDFDEWVLLVQGYAKLQLADNQYISLSSGDYLLIPAHTRHRVELTAPDIETIWLAIRIQTLTK